MGKNILFCGFGELGTKCAERLIKENYNLAYILTHEEGLDQSIDTFAIKNQIDYSYKDLRNAKNLKADVLDKLKIDYIISVNYKYILTKEILSISKYAINIHGSLLPKYRGRTPHVWSIINGEVNTGVTCHLIDEGIDTGDIIEQRVIRIEDNDTGHSLLEKFQAIYPDLLISSLEKLQKDAKTTLQNEIDASYYGKRTPDMGYIDFYKSKTQIINFVRAQAHPYPGAYYYLANGSKIVINSIGVEENIGLLVEEIGIIKDIDNQYYVKCMDGLLKLMDFEIYKTDLKK